MYYIILTKLYKFVYPILYTEEKDLKEMAFRMEIEASQKKEEIPLFFDHAKQCWRPKKLDLDRIPMKYRCPSCGKIVVKPQDRNPKKITHWLYNENHEYIGSEVEWVPNEEFEHTADSILYLGMTGGVCEKCWLAGLGKYGHTGKLFSWGMSEEFEKFAEKVEGRLRKKGGVRRQNE